MHDERRNLGGPGRVPGAGLTNRPYSTFSPILRTTSPHFLISERT